MRKIRRIVSVIMASIMMLASLSGCGKKSTDTDSDTDKYITRGAWVEAIGTIWGMDEYNEKVPYFTDVPSDSEIFPYVQSCYEWNVISTDTKEFKKDDVATLGFAVSSATMILSAADVDITNEELLQKAVEYKILDEADNTQEGLRQGITSEQADNIISLTKAAYFAENENQVCDIDIVDGVKDYSKDTDKIVQISDSSYTVDESIASELKTADVFIAPSDTDISGQEALKVVSSKNNGDGTYTVTTELPEADEVFEAVDIEGTYYPDYTLIQPEEGVKVVPLDENDFASETAYDVIGQPSFANCITQYDESGNPITTGVNKNTIKGGFKFEVELGSGGVKANASGSVENENGDSFGIKIGEGGYPVFTNKEAVTGDPRIEAEFDMADVSGKVAESFEDMNISGNDLINNNAIDMLKNFSDGLITDKSITEKLNKSKSSTITPEKEFKKGYKIKGSIAVKDMQVTPDIKIDNILKVKHASVSVTGKIVNTLSVSGTISSDIKIATIPIATVGIASVDLDMYLYMDLNGEISVKTTITVNTKVEYNGKKVKKSTDCQVTPEAEVKASVEAGAAVAVAVKAFGIDIISIRLKAGLLLDTSVKETFDNKAYMDGDDLVYEQKADVKIGVNLYAPVIKIEFNKTKKCLLGKFISGEYIISDKDSIDKGKENGSGFGNLCLKQELLGEDFTLYTIKFRVHKPDETEEETGLGDYLSLDHLAQEVKTGATVELKVENIPSGYKESDIIWSSDDTSIATVKNGKVKGVAEGTTNVTVSTSDGKYSASCVISVSE